MFLQIVKNCLIILILVSSFKIILCIDVQFITTKIKSLKCEFDPSVYNGTMFCKIRPTRDEHGNITGLYNFFEPAYDIWYHLKIYYKFGLVYRPFMVDVDADLCKFMENPYKIPKMLKYIADYMLDEFSYVLHRCPYVGEEGFRNLDGDAFLGRIIPQVSKI